MSGAEPTGRTRRHGALMALLAAASLLLALLPAAPAAANGPSHVKILGTGEPGALDARAYLGEFWAVIYGTPPDEFPACFRLGLHGRVLAVPGSTECTVREGDPLFAEGFTTANSSLEDPMSSDATVQRRVARSQDYAFTRTALLSVDGGRPVELRAHRFEVVTRQRTVLLPENNVFGPGTASQLITLTAHGWMATIRGLTPGLHHITRTRVFDFGNGPEPDEVDQMIRVLPRN